VERKQCDKILKYNIYIYICIYCNLKYSDYACALVSFNQDSTSIRPREIFSHILSNTLFIGHSDSVGYVF
jgi:hypothetical protein